MALVYKTAPSIMLCPEQLREAINNNPAIVPICESITVDAEVDLTMTFDLALSAAEDLELETMINVFTCPVGSTGDPTEVDIGAGLVVESDTVPVMSDVQNLNLEGVVAVTDSGNSRTTIHVGTVNVKNDSVNSIPAGHPIYVKGYDSATNELLVDAADAADPSKMPALGVAGNLMTSNQSGLGILQGELHNVDTTSYSIGDSIYVRPAGGLGTKPTGTNKIQRIGQVLTTSATGSILISQDNSASVPNLAPGQAWVGSTNGVATPTPVYTQLEVDASLVGTARVVGYGGIVPIVGAAAIPDDPSVPLITEGTRILRQPITPSATDKKIKFTMSLMAAAQRKDLVVALFRDDTCIATQIYQRLGDDDGFNVTMVVIDTPATTNEVVYTVRVGTAHDEPYGLWYINRMKPALFGDTMAYNGYVIEEF